MALQLCQNIDTFLIQTEGAVMPAIRPSSDLRNKYSDISRYCHDTQTPVFITKNGAGDLAVMSIEAYERLVSIHTLRAEIDKGLQDMKSGRTISVEAAFSALEQAF